MNILSNHLLNTKERMSVGKLFIKTITPLWASICLTEKHRGCFFKLQVMEELTKRSQLGCVSGLVPCWCSFLPGVHGTTETLTEALLMGIAPCPDKLSHHYLHILLLILYSERNWKSKQIQFIANFFFFTVNFFIPTLITSTPFKSKLGAETDFWLPWELLERVTLGKWPRHGPARASCTF